LECLSSILAQLDTPEGTVLEVSFWKSTSQAYFRPQISFAQDEVFETEGIGLVTADRLAYAPSEEDVDSAVSRKMRQATVGRFRDFVRARTLTVFAAGLPEAFARICESDFANPRLPK